MLPFRSLPVLAAAGAIAFLSSCSSDKPGESARTYNLGDRMDVGNLNYRIFEAQWMTQLPADPTPRIPQNRFLVVRLSAENPGSGDVLIPGFTLEADGGNTYTELNSGEGVPQWLGILRKVKAGGTVTGKVVFDAPPQHYKLRIADESSENAALVDIPLNLNPEAPAPVAIPEGKKQ